MKVNRMRNGRDGEDSVIGESVHPWNMLAVVVNMPDVVMVKEILFPSPEMPFNSKVDLRGIHKRKTINNNID